MRCLRRDVGSTDASKQSLVPQNLEHSARRKRWTDDRAQVGHADELQLSQVHVIRISEASSSWPAAQQLPEPALTAPGMETSGGVPEVRNFRVLAPGLDRLESFRNVTVVAVDLGSREVGPTSQHVVAGHPSPSVTPSFRS